MAVNGKPVILYDNVFDDNTLTVSGTGAGDYAAEYLDDWRRYTFYEPDVLTAYNTVDCLSAKPVDYLLVYNHSLGTNGCTINIIGSSDNFATVNDTVISYTPPDDLPFIIQATQQSYRYWKREITGAGAVPYMAICAAGAALELPKFLRNGFDPIGKKVVGKRNRAIKGAGLGSIIHYQEWSQRITQLSIDPTWVRDTFDVAWEAHLKGNPFGFAWEPVNHKNEIYLADMQGEFSAPHHGTLADLSFSLAGSVL